MFLAVKRLMREACELREPTDEYYAHPIDDNLFEWHFTVKGPEETEFQGGLYHGRILLPTEYPMKPPNIILLTPNGRFETNKKICLSISGHHPETWQPSWSIRTALLALRAFMPTPGNGTIGSLDYTPKERELLARSSQNWKCSSCGKLVNLLSPEKNVTSAPVSQVESDLIKQVVFKGEDSNQDTIGKNDLTKPSTSPAKIEEKSQYVEENIPAGPATDTVPGSSGSDWDMYINFLMGLIVAAIAFLVFRRLYLL
uniref:UBC core domain-containing protein n=1 Tax=Clastoptera arizonana TaxID=38151 RepID=A0A1B6D8V1_9HEMI